MHYKGQYFSFDAIIATVIFILALLALLSYWHSLRTSLDVQSGDITKEAIRISDALLTPGYDPRVEVARDCAAMTQLGLGVSWSDKRIDNDKFQCAKGLRDDLSSKLTSPYSVSVEVRRGNAVEFIGKDLSAINRDAIRNIARVRRIATLVEFGPLPPPPEAQIRPVAREELVIMDVYVYR